jgi:hypothetical protein
MSSKLISDENWQHSVTDDLESSIWVLLWVTLVYSTCSKPEQVGQFMKQTLDPVPLGKVGGYAKADFLKGRTFLDEVSFPGREELHELIYALAKVFSIRHLYEPTDDQWRTLQTILECNLDKDTKSRLLSESYAHKYRRDMETIQDHKAIIRLYNEALALPRWPTDDSAVRQNIITDNDSRRSTQGLKTGYSTTVIDKMDVDVFRTI